MRTCLLILAFAFCAAGCSRQKDISTEEEPVKAFCIDFNWGPGGPNAFPSPGLWADADPEEHIQWYQDMGCNIVQTFAVSCNGYAWYKGGIIPEQPGLKHDFLTEMVKLGHERDMKVFGYFCVGANTKWGLDNPELSYGIPSAPHIPLTTEYLDYLCASIEDAIRKTNMDGYMVDWIWNPGGTMEPYPPLKWLECERKMFAELMEQDFPGTDRITPELEREFRRKAIARCWERMYETTKKTDPDCQIWVTCCQVDSGDLTGSEMFGQADILMNEAGDIAGVKSIEDKVGEHTKLLTCLALWNQQDPSKIIPDAIEAGIGLYGFTKPQQHSLLPPVSFYLSKPADEFQGDDRNIAYLARIYNNLEIDYVSK